MTHQERDALLAVSSVALTFQPHPTDPTFVQLVAKPCPLLADGLCSVYDSRPVNCRRFACGRDDLSEPFESSPIPQRALTDRAFRRQMVLMQRKAMKSWGHSHGWTA